MLSVVERARWKCEDVCFLLFPVQVFPKLIFRSGRRLVPGEGQPVWRSLVAAGIKVGLRKDFCGAEKMSGIAPVMILIGARGLELKVGWLMASSAEVDEQSDRSAPWVCGSKDKQAEIWPEGLVPGVASNRA